MRQWAIFLERGGGDGSLRGGGGRGRPVGQVGGEHLRVGLPVDIELYGRVTIDAWEGSGAQGGHQLAAGEAGGDVEHAFALVEGESGDVYQADDVARRRSAGGDDRAAVAVAGQQHGTVDLGGDAGNVGGVGRQAAQGAGHGDDADPSGLQLGEDASPHRSVRERAVHEKYGGGAPISWRR